MTLSYTPVSVIPGIVAGARASFLTHRTQSLEFRKEQLRALQRCMKENEADFLAAVYKDLHRPKDFEIDTINGAINSLLENLDSLTQDQKAKGQNDADKSFVRLSPLGTVLIIGAWNFPILLLVEPLAGAIAAGNTCVVKPSEVSEESAALLARLLPKYMDPAVVAVVSGGAEETTVLLKQRFDHIFYTGGTTVGRIVMEAAAKNLTPVTLELGGKCPAIITESADIEKAAPRIAFWKSMNSGQVCLSVNYILCPKRLQEPLIQHVIGTWKHLYGGADGKGDFKNSGDYPRVINKRQFDRLEGILNKAKQENTVVFGGDLDPANLYIQPSVVTNVKLNDEIMKDELFGPFLPIVDCETVDEAIKIVNQQEHALSMSIFSNNQDEIEKVLRETRSGSVSVNDIAANFGDSSLPFGGVGNSGIGSYHGKYTIDTFSHKRAVIIRDPNHL
ncbi:aldehyde dehydrogenase 3 family, member A2 [Mortierella sp. GBAus27b]|nr:aldehyde dehydrogenase 3, member A2 [Mortierella sp. GBA43]KAI8359446.1 aldehyde dehydrogenase 3 family, member A2 [Mortierella sp. GBAus27b]